MFKFKKPRLSFLAPILLLTASCAVSTTETPLVNDFCQIASPMTFSGKFDSIETQKEVLAFDEKYSCLCQNICPKTIQK